jgi:hypothetical protein
VWDVESSLVGDAAGEGELGVIHPRESDEEQARLHFTLSQLLPPARVSAAAISVLLRLLVHGALAAAEHVAEHANAALHTITDGHLRTSGTEQQKT